MVNFLVRRLLLASHGLEQLQRIASNIVALDTHPAPNDKILVIGKKPPGEVWVSCHVGDGTLEPVTKVPVP